MEDNFGGRPRKERIWRVVVQLAVVAVLVGSVIAVFAFGRI